jgi:hypothetical protein
VESEGHAEKYRAVIEGATPQVNWSAKGGTRSSLQIQFLAGFCSQPRGFHETGSSIPIFHPLECERPQIRAAGLSTMLLQYVSILAGKVHGQ